MKCWRKKLKNNPGAAGFIFDGFPRTVPQAEALDEFLGSKNTGIHAVVQLDVTQEELKRRLAERKTVFNRADDEEEKVLKRMEEYFNKTIHVLPYYEAQGKLAKVNGIGEIENIFNQLCEKIDDLSHAYKN